MDSEVLEAHIEVFKNNIDPDLAHLPLEEFVEAVALTPRERKQAKNYLMELNIKQ